MRGIRQRRGDARRRQVIITGQSLGQAVTHVREALQFGVPGWTAYNTSVGSSPYSVLKRGTYPFARSVVAGGGAVLCIHGESDAWIVPYGGTYAGYIAEWAADYALALGGSIPFALTQVSSRLYDYGYGAEMNRVAFDQTTAALSNSGDNIFLVGPMYQYPYQADLMHLTWPGYSWLGQKCGQIMGRIVSGVNWKPLYPLSAARTGATLTLTLNVPYAPLVVDTTTVSARTNYGFVFSDSNGSATIASVAVGATTITFTLTGTPTGTVKRLYYAHFAQTGAPIADWAGAPSYAAGGLAAGNIRDSDTAAQYVPSWGPYQMGNWLTHFMMDVP